MKLGQLYVLAGNWETLDGPRCSLSTPNHRSMDQWSADVLAARLRKGPSGAVPDPSMVNPSFLHSG